MSNSWRCLAAFTSLALMGAGCVAHETVGRPPSATEIERINEFSHDHGGLSVAYVTSPPSCAAGSCGAEERVGLLPERLTRIVSCDERQMIVDTEEGKPWQLQTPTVVSVSARSRGRGAAVGALVGLGIGVLETLGVLALAESSAFRDPDPSAPKPPDTTAGDVARNGLVLSLSNALVMAGFGYLIGGRRSFDFQPLSAPGRQRIPPDIDP
jgi:hypothetical protein